MNFKEWLLLTEKIVYDGKNYETVMDLLNHLKNKSNTYVSFQKYPQLEIWPGQHKTYDTPVGVYAYPIKYVSDELENIPFAAQQPYLIIFKSTGKIIGDDLTEKQQQDYLEKLKKMYPATDLNEVNDYEIRSAFSKLWIAVIMVIAPDNPSKQNKIFRQLGIDGFDDDGTGTIHQYEPTQAVFFKPQTLQKIKVLDNVLHTSLVGKQPLQKYPKGIIKKGIQNKEEIIQNKNEFEKYTNYIMRNNKTQEINDINSKFLLSHSKEPDKMAKFIIKNKKYLDYNDVDNLLQHTTDKDEMAKFIVQNKEGLDSNAIDHLLKGATDKDDMAEFIIQNKKDLNYNDFGPLTRHTTDKYQVASSVIQNKKDLRGLLQYANDRGNMAKFIIQKKKDLTAEDVYYLVLHATDKDEIEKLLGSENINKLPNYRVKDFLLHAPDKYEMAKLLGQDNIKKLTIYDVGELLRYETEPYEMRSVLQKYGRIQ